MNKLNDVYRVGRKDRMHLKVSGRSKLRTGNRDVVVVDIMDKDGASRASALVCLDRNEQHEVTGYSVGECVQLANHPSQHVEIGKTISALLSCERFEKILDAAVADPGFPVNYYL